MNEYKHQDLTHHDPIPSSPSPAPDLEPAANAFIPLNGPAEQSAILSSASRPAPAAFLATKRMRLTLIMALLLSVLLANFVFLNGFTLGFFLTVAAAQAVLFIVLPKPSSPKVLWEGIFLSASILGLAATFFIYSDGLLAFLDFLVLMFLFLLQLILYSETLSYDWDNPGFFVELLLSPFLRPFVSLPSFFRVAKSFRANKTGQEDPVSEKRKSVTLKIVVGLLIALPMMALVIVLLSSADPVYKMIFQSILDFISQATAEEIVATVFLTLLCFPFIFSVLYSFLTKWKDSSISKELPTVGKSRFHLDSVVVATILSCINVLYGIFAYVQFSALFGAFKMDLPQGITYAEYAREGFFQLAAIASLNLVFVVLSVLFTQRRSRSGIFVRILSVLLILFTFVQLASAAYRMKMYIDVYSLSKLRILVSIFIGLIAVLLVLAFIKEFFPGFRFFKSAVVAAVLVLLFTNYINTNGLVARYNTTRYLENTLQSASKPAQDAESVKSGTHETVRADKIDIHYLVNELSYDAIPYVIPLLGAKDRVVSAMVKEDLLALYDNFLREGGFGDFRRFSLSKANAKKAIEKYFGDNLKAELETLYKNP